MNVNTLSTVNVGTNLIVGRDPLGSATLNVNGANAVVNAPASPLRSRRPPPPAIRSPAAMARFP